MKKTLHAVAIILGMVIGAGVLGIPYAFAKSGIIYGLINLLLVGSFITIINLQLGEVILRTKGKHQLTGYAEKYLGKAGKELMAFSMVIGIYGALIAYLIGSADTLVSLFGGDHTFYIIVYFILFSPFIYAGIKTISRTETLFMFVKFCCFVLVILSILPHMHKENIILREFDPTASFFPFGVVLFSLLGMASLPEAREALGYDTRKFKKVVILASLIPIVIYALFAVSFVAIIGSEISEVATVSLRYVNLFSFVVGSFFALFSMTTAYLANGLALQEMYNYDYKINKNIAFTLTCFVPLALIFLGVKSFIKTLAIGGAFSGGITAFLVTLMFYKAKKNGERPPEYEIKGNIFLSAFILIIFVLGVIIEILNIIG